MCYLFYVTAVTSDSWANVIRPYKEIFTVDSQLSDFCLFVIFQRPSPSANNHRHVPLNKLPSHGFLQVVSGI